MRAAFGLVLIVGIALAGGAVMMAKNYIDAHRTALAAERAKGVQNVPTVDVIIANQQLTYGRKLRREQVATIAWPAAAVPEGAFTDPAALFPSDTPEGARFVLRTMEKHEPILAVKVTNPGEDAGITSRLAKGMRAFAIRVDVASGVSGFLRPNDRVDVYWTGSMPGANGRSQGEVTRLIQPNVELIAVDQVAAKDVQGAIIARTVTVSADPEQIAALAQAQSTGRLSLSLVGAKEDTVAGVVEVDQRKLLGLATAEAPAPVEEKRICTIRTRRGAEVMNIPIPCSN